MIVKPIKQLTFGYGVKALPADLHISMRIVCVHLELARRGCIVFSRVESGVRLDSSDSNRPCCRHLELLVCFVSSMIGCWRMRVRWFACRNQTSPRQSWDVCSETFWHTHAVLNLAVSVRLLDVWFLDCFQNSFVQERMLIRTWIFCFLPRSVSSPSTFRVQECPEVISAHWWVLDLCATSCIDAASCKCQPFASRLLKVWHVGIDTCPLMGAGFLRLLLWWFGCLETTACCFNRLWGVRTALATSTAHSWVLLCFECHCDHSAGHFSRLTASAIMYLFSERWQSVNMYTLRFYALNS